MQPMHKPVASNLNIECVLNDDGSPVVNWRIDNIKSIEPATGGYGYLILEGDAPIDWLLSAAAGAFVFANPIIGTFEGQMDQEYTLQVVLDNISVDLVMYKLLHQKL
jgi:hypothetical protein